MFCRMHWPFLAAGRRSTNLRRTPAEQTRLPQRRSARPREPRGPSPLTEVPPPLWLGGNAAEKPGTPVAQLKCRKTSATCVETKGRIRTTRAIIRRNTWSHSIFQSTSHIATDSATQIDLKIETIFSVLLGLYPRFTHVVGRRDSSAQGRTSSLSGGEERSHEA